MCILFIYREPNPREGKYRLILVSNRDEYYARPAQPAQHWQDYPSCLGGMDMEPGREGGTWLALNYKTGRIGVILNLNGVPKSAEGKGRGFLVRDYITSPNSTMEHANKLHKINQETQCYNPFNLVMVDIRNSDICYLSSIQNFPGPITIDKEFLGFGNSGMEEPYQKVLVGEQRFEKLLHDAKVSQQEELIEDLIEFLKQEERHLPDEELKKRSPEAFNELSSIFVRHEKAKYGTRTHTVILVDDSYNLTFVEETLKPDGSWGRRLFRQHLE